MTFDSVCRGEVKDKAVLALAIAVDTPHALFQTVWIPGNIVIKKDASDLEVDTFTGSLSCYQYLAFTE
jgi:hypothetical protein